MYILRRTIIHNQITNKDQPNKMFDGISVTEITHKDAQN